MQTRLNGKGIVVIGGSSGMGKAQVRRFIIEGAKVLIADRNVVAGEALVQELGDSVQFIQHDVRDENNWKNVIRFAEDFFDGPIDGLVNNAGILVEASLEDTSLETYQELIDIMQVGAFLGMKAAATSMRAKKGGSIITVSSTAGIVGYPCCFAYTAAKFAVRGMTKAAALDLADANIRVNSVHPGDTETPMIEGLGYRADAVPLKRFAEVDEIASLVLFLLSDESTYITGAEMVIDGGFTAQ
ncbi:SDR family oxidoreductase [Rouxiella badensis]|uniref:SDR family oxidoreductase n=1 Tax=Rouxiella badensis TaxID=1646377 RepID=UPI0022AA36D6|nr:SDR family oxidoreductase [Rouxiella badensis]WAT09674.1 SDR family oxidoreductase [Rouxiella badensis]